MNKLCNRNKKVQVPRNAFLWQYPLPPPSWRTPTGAL